jgi:hypothetical protein
MSTQAVKLEAMLRRVQALLRQADHANTPPTEANTFRAKAEALMMAYRIDEAMLVAESGGGIKPKWGELDVCNERSEFSEYYRSICRSVIDHVDVRGLMRTKRSEPGGPWLVRCEYVGFDSDLRVVGALFTSAQLAFQTRLEPRYDPELSEQVNAYNMRRAGMEGWRIASALWGNRDEKNLYKARRLFKKEALERGEDPSELLGQGNSMKNYRDSYAYGFARELEARLLYMRYSRGANSAEVALAGRKEAIDAAFYERYPEYAPAKPLPTGPVTEDDSEESGEGQEPNEGELYRNHARTTYTDPRATCGKCQKAKSGYCRDHSYLRPRTVQYREVPLHPVGLKRGREAARSLDLGPSSGGRSLS